MNFVYILTFILTSFSEALLDDINAEDSFGPSRRQARSLGILELAQIIPLLMQPKSLHLENQVLADQNRQVPVPPPPATTIPPPPIDQVDTPAKPTLLQTLLPLIGLTRMLGGSVGSVEAAMLPSLLSKLGTGSGVLHPNIYRDIFPLTGMRSNTLRPTTSAVNILDAKSIDQCNRVSSPICDDAPFDKIISIGDNVLALKERRVYRIHPDGSPVNVEPVGFDPMLRNISSAANIRGTDYIFQGSHYFKLNDGTLDQPTVRLVEDGFPSVPVPVEGVFQIDPRTFVFISGSRFVYYQPEANPPVTPSYSPQFLGNVPGAPSTVNSVFRAGTRLFLYRSGTLYEMEPGQMAVKQEMPLKSENGRGWLKCAESTSRDCGKGYTVEGYNQRTISINRANGP